MRATYRVVSGLIALAVVFRPRRSFGTFGVINEVESGAVVAGDSTAGTARPGGRTGTAGVRPGGGRPRVRLPHRPAG